MKNMLLNFFELLKKRRMRFLMLSMGGIFSGLMLVLPAIGFLQWIAMIPAAAAILSIANDERVRFRGLYGYGVFYFMCYYPVVYHWFINLYPLDFIEGMTPMSAIAVVLAGVFGLSAIQAVMGGIVFIVVGACFRTRLAKRFFLLKPLAAAGAWAVLEWTQTLGWIGVPWGRLAIGQAAYSVGIQTASLFGSYFISFLIVAVNFLIVCAVEHFAVGERKTFRLSLILASAAIVFHYGAGAALYFLDPETSETEPIKVAAVQGNISSNEKWGVSSSYKCFEVYGRLSREAAENGADMILWPESAIPFSIDEGEYAHNYLVSLAKSCGVPIIAGGFMNGEERGEYNALVCFMPNGDVLESFYAKRHLVPFGEYVPMEKLINTLIPPLGDLVMGGYTIIPGKGAQLMEINGLTVGGLICFDSIYEALALDSIREGAEVIFLSTNDSWFTDSAALDMHNAQAKLRAVECGRYVVRAANTGISSVITPRGDMISTMEILEEGYIMEEIYEKQDTTLYSVIGNAFVYALMLGLVALLMAEKLHIKK